MLFPRQRHQILFPKKKKLKLWDPISNKTTTLLAIATYFVYAAYSASLFFSFTFQFPPAIPVTTLHFFSFISLSPSHDLSLQAKPTITLIESHSLFTSYIHKILL